ncbi:MAG: methylated-DNA--[protein]-cysteine S-methyltransferase [Vicinamibacteria bacterium]
MRRLSRVLAQARLEFDRDGSPDPRLELLADILDAFAQVFAEPVADEDRASAIHVGWMETAIGPLIAASFKGSLVLLEFTHRARVKTQIAALKKRFQAPFLAEDDAIIEQTRRELDEYFGGRRKDFTIPLDFPGTPFEMKVWDELLKIPFGETRSYEELALITSSKGAVRAVGSANGRNRIAIVIPCHRVVNKSGSLGGYGGGVWRKQLLLSLEQGAKLFVR